VSPSVTRLLRDAATLAIALDFFPAQLTADQGQAMLVGIVDEGQLGLMPHVDPALSLILVPRDESPVMPPPPNVVSMQGDFVSAVRWVADIAERAGDSGTDMRVRLSYVSTGQQASDWWVPQDRQTGSAVVPRVLVSGRAWGRAEFAGLKRAARGLSFKDQKIQRHGAGAFQTKIGRITFIFSRTGQLQDSGQEVEMRPTPSEVSVRRSGSQVVVKPSGRRP
jgi:hypothetical protein